MNWLKVLIDISWDLLIWYMQMSCRDYCLILNKCSVFQIVGVNILEGLPCTFVVDKHVRFLILHLVMHLSSWFCAVLGGLWGESKPQPAGKGAVDLLLLLDLYHPSSWFVLCIYRGRAGFEKNLILCMNLKIWRKLEMLYLMRYLQSIFLGFIN